MTASNTYTEPYGPKASLRGVDVSGTLTGALNEQRGVDGQTYYATDLRQLLVWDNMTFQSWAPVDGKTLYQAYAAGPPVVPRYLYDEFRAASMDSRYAIDNGGGTGAASPASLSGDNIGEVNLVTGTANGATACSALTLATVWTPNVVQPWQAVGAAASAGAGTFKQKMTLLGKVKCSSITSASFFLGFTDTLATTAATSQTPLTLASGAASISATNTGISNAVGFLLDTTDNGHVWAASANAGTPTTPVDCSLATGAPAIAASTYLLYKLTVDTSGNATFYMAAVPSAGSAPTWVQVATIAAAVAAAAALSPAAYVASRSATSVTLTLDAWAAN